MSLCWWGGWWWGVWGDARGHGSGWNHEWWTADDIQNLGWYSAHWKHWYSTSQWGRKYNQCKALLSILYIGHFSHFRAFPHQRKSCLFGQIFCHHQHFTSVDGLSWLDKFWLFKCTVDKICPRWKLNKINYINETMINLSIMCGKSWGQHEIELKSVY